MMAELRLLARSAAWEVSELRCVNCGYPCFDVVADAEHGVCYRCWIARHSSEFHRGELQMRRGDLVSVLRQLPGGAA